MARKKAVKKTSKKAKRSGKPRADSRRQPVSAPTGSKAPSKTPAPAAPEPKPKSPFSSEELVGYRQLLLEKRAELVDDVRAMTNEALRDNPPGGSGNLSSVPIHMADVGTDNWEQEFTLGLLETERELLKEIDAALARIEDKTYGVCEATHKPIGKRRLRAKPWARYCIEHARAKELGQAR